MIRNILMVCLIGCLVVSCASPSAQKGGVGGAAGGALIGQVIGHDTEATLLGAAIGGILGYVVGNEMEKYDRIRLNRTYETTPSYESTRWQNPDTGHSYSVTPRPAYEDPQYGRVCRKAEIEATIDGKREITEAVACREDGHWVLQQ
jgi:surface antigen